MIERPNPIEYAPFYARYVSLVEGENLLETLESQKSQLHGVMKSIPHDRETFRYEPEKWSIREVFGHLTDAERVFGYRAFCISRGDQTPLPGFDEVSYMERSSYHGGPVTELGGRARYVVSYRCETLEPGLKLLAKFPQGCIYERKGQR